MPGTTTEEPGKRCLSQTAVIALALSLIPFGTTAFVPLLPGIMVIAVGFGNPVLSLQALVLAMEATAEIRRDGGKRGRVIAFVAGCLALLYMYGFTVGGIFVHGSLR